MLEIECINVTSLDTQLEALLSSKASVIFFQEHKLRKNEVKKMRRQLRQAGWMVHLGPSDESGKKPSAGVGVMWREGAVQIFHQKVKGEALREAAERGIVAKYVMDVGWERAYTVYNIYGCSGGSRECKATTEALMTLCREEMQTDVHNPTMMCGDFNARPNTLGPIAAWIREECWTDVGHKADWWGGIADRWACQSRADAKPSRIDGMVVDAEALGSVRSFEVENRTHIPTHCVLKFSVTRNAFQEKRTFLHKLGSLKNNMEAKWKEAFKEKEPKEAAKSRAVEIQKLKESMDEAFGKAASRFEGARLRKGHR